MENISQIPVNLVGSDFFLVTGSESALAQLDAAIDANPLLTKLITVGDGLVPVANEVSKRGCPGYGFNGIEGRSALVHVLADVMYSPANRRRLPENKIRHVADVQYMNGKYKTCWSHWSYQQIGVDLSGI